MKCGGCGGAAHGAVGLAKAITGIGHAPADEVERRRAICRQCREAVPCLKLIGKFCKCRECGCILHAKTLLADEACPLGKWDAVTQPEEDRHPPT